MSQQLKKKFIGNDQVDGDKLLLEEGQAVRAMDGATEVELAKIASSEVYLNGFKVLESSGLIPSARLPSYVDDVLEFADLAAFPVSGEAGKIYIALDTNKQYRWSGSVYVQITSGAVDSVNGETGVVTLDAGDIFMVSAPSTTIESKLTGLQDELDATQTGAGLGIDGGYTPLITADYISTATDLRDADIKLDAALAQEVQDRIDANGTIQDNIDNHINAVTDAHDASAISVAAGIPNLDATDVQGALAEIQGQLDTVAGDFVDVAGDTMTGPLTMEAANIVVEYSDSLAGTVSHTILGQDDILMESSNGDFAGYSEIWTGNVELSTVDASQSTGDVTLNVSATFGNPVFSATTTDYQNDGSNSVIINPSELAVSSTDNASGQVNNATYGAGSFGYTQTMPDNTGYSGGMDPLAGAYVYSMDTLGAPHAIMPTAEYNLTPKKYVDDQDAIQSAAISAHLADAVDAHDASAISVAAGITNLAATDVQGALAELQADADSRVKKAGDTMSGLLDITVVGAVGLEVNDIVIGEPWGAGYSVISVKDGGNDEMYIQSADHIDAFAGASKQMVVASGFAQGADSGPVQITTGDALVSGNSGNINIHSGAVASGNTGAVNVASQANASLGTTGTAQIQSGVISNISSSADTGFAQIRSGNNAGSGSSGVVYVASGNNTGTGNSGNISLYTGTVSSGTRGKITLQSSLAEIYSQLDMKSHKIVSLSAGSASGDAVEFDQYSTALGLKADKDLGNLVVSPVGAYHFPSSVNFTSGWNDVKSENATGSSNSGGIGFKSGDADSGNSGVVALGSGDSTSGLAGDVYLFSGMGASGRGIVQIEASKLNILNAIDMNSHKINQLSDGVLASDAVNKGQLDDGLALKLSLSGGDMSGGINMQNNTITHLTMTNDADSAATKQYVDNVAEGLHVHAPVRLVRSGQIVGTYDNGTSGVGATITPTSPLTLIDGIGSFAVNQRIMVKGQSNTWENGIYVVSAVDGSNHITELTRASDFDTAIEVSGGDFIFAQEGDSYANSGWVETKTTTALGFGVSDPIEFLQFSGAGAYSAGDGLNLDGTVFSVDVADLIGFGIGYDGSNNFRIASEAAGDGISGGDGVALSVDHDSLGLTFVGGQLSLAIDASMLDKASGDLKLADTSVSAGSWGTSASRVASFTVDQQGRLTAASDQDISINSSQVTDFTSAAQGAISVSDSNSIDLSYLSGDISADLKLDPVNAALSVSGFGLYLADTTVSSGSFGSASEAVSITVDAQGRLTAASAQSIDITASQVSDFISSAQSAISVSDTNSMDLSYSAGVISADLRLDSANSALSVGVAGLKLEDTAVSAGSFGSASQSVSITVDQQGRLTAASAQSIDITASQVSDFTSAAQGAISVSDSNSIDLSYSAGAISADLKLANNSLSISPSGLSVANRHNKEAYTIVAADTVLTSNYYDLDFEIEANSLVAFVDRLAIHEGSSFDYTLSVVGGVTRVTFLNTLVTPGQQKLAAGDQLFFTYAKKAV